MAVHRPETALPPHVLDRADMRDAIAGHDFGTVFALARKWAGISYSKIAEACGVKPERVAALARGEGSITTYEKIIQIADAFRIPGYMLGLAARPWENTTPVPTPGAALSHERVLVASPSRSQGSTGEQPTDAEAAGLKRLKPLYHTDPAMHRLTTIEGWNDMHRRTFVLAAGGLAGLGLAAPALTLETMRHGLTLTLAQQRAETTVDEWQEIVTEYGYSYMTAAPADLLDSLVTDVLGIQYAIAHHHDGHGDEAVLRELRRAGALLAAFMAMTVANLGQMRHAERWWRSARRIAHHSGDVATVTWVRGREVGRALYEQRPLGMILRLADEAEAHADGAPLRALPELVSGKAQALALAGHTDDAKAALHHLREIHAALPSEATTDSATIFAWAEDRLRTTESFVYSQLGDVEQATVAQDRALAAYPSTNRRGPAQIELQRALCLVRGRAVTEGVRHAQSVMAALSPTDYIRPIFDLGHRVLEAVPVDQRASAAATELRGYLTTLDATA